MGEVKHFSCWNCDYSNPALTVSLKLVNSKGLPLIYASISIRSSTKGTGHGYTDSLGQVSGLVPANDDLILEVLSECGQVVYSQNIGSFSKNTNLGNITVRNTTSSIVTIEGKITGCNNAPVSKGYAIINFDNITRYADVDNSGDFSTTFITCSATSATCEILGIDETTQEQGTFATIPIAALVTFVGNISACGNSSSEFINYNIDGTDYNLSISAGSAGDSALVYSYPGPAPLFTTYVRGDGGGNFINFDFSHNNSTGIFPLNNCSSTAFLNMKLIKPFTVSVTNYPQNIGEFYAGNFAGQFTDSLIATPVHKITCSFRLRKNN